MMMPLSSGYARVGHRGMALVTVLWVVTLLTVIAASFALGMRREAGITHNLQQAAEARLLAEAGVRHAMLMLQHPDEGLRWSGDGQRRLVAIDGRTVYLRVRDAVASLDLNYAPREWLDSLFAQAGLEDASARARVVDNVLDWRDPSTARRLHGDGAAGYQAAGLEYGPRNGPFPAVDELTRVLGMTPELYRRVAPVLTVHSHQLGVDPAAADRRLLEAIPGADEAVVAVFMRDREAALEQGDTPPKFPLAVEPMATADGKTYSIESFLPPRGGAQAGLSLFVARSPGAVQGPFMILSYRDGWDSTWVGGSR